jgi:bifunctional DNase/RNase
LPVYKELEAMAEVTVHGLKGSLDSRHWTVILKDVNADRYLPIWTSPLQANAIAVQLAGVNVERPLSHDLLKTVIQEVGAEVSHILINDLVENVFYARINMNIAGRHVEIDSRPSDAIALAVRIKAPILVDETVMKRAGITLEPESKKTPVEEEDELAIFRDFISNLDLDDS